MLVKPNTNQEIKIRLHALAFLTEFFKDANPELFLNEENKKKLSSVVDFLIEQADKLTNQNVFPTNEVEEQAKQFLEESGEIQDCLDNK